jgi:hypothetical protein
MKTLNSIGTAALALGVAVAVACGYSSKPAPPTSGNIPAISQLSPASVSHGSAGFAMTVNGTSFNSNAVVNWNGTGMTATTRISGQQLMVNIPAASIASSGSVQVTVTNPGTAGTGPYGGGGTMAETSAPMTFTIK